MLVKYQCAYCSKDAEYDTKDAVVIKARIESEQLGKDVFYHAIRCPHCGARNERKPPKEEAK
jgi:DNA-directed RNA polymerase subunit RPC12/RpoP